MKCIIYVRDEDINEDGSTSYDELGMLEIPFLDIILNGKRMQGNSFVLSAAWYSLKKSPGMRKAEGDIKMCCSLVFGTNDTTKLLFTQINTLKENKTGSIIEPPKTLNEFTEQLISAIKPPSSRPTSALRRSLTGSNDNGTVTSATASKRPLSGQSIRSKGDGMAKKHVATPIRRKSSEQREESNLGPDSDLESSFGVGNMNPYEDEVLDEMDPIQEDGEDDGVVSNYLDYNILNIYIL